MAEENKQPKPQRLKKDGTPWIPGFVKGHAPSGNAIKGYTEKKRRDNEAIKIEMEIYAKREILKKKKELVQALIEKAVAKDVPALREVFDRVMGKSVTPMEIGGKDGQPIQVMSFRDFGQDKKEEK